MGSIGVGFAGSMTSFSTFMANCFEALANVVPYYSRSSGYNVMALLGQIVITISASLGGISLGASIYLSCERYMRPIGSAPVFEVIVASSLALASLIACSVLAGTASGFVWKSVALTGVFAPFGTLLRYFLSRRLNGRFASFPLGTFTANITGTVIISVSLLLTFYPFASISIIDCAVLRAVANGFCGCLTTVSTLALELSTLKLRHAWRYGSASIICGLCVTILIL